MKKKVKNVLLVLFVLTIVVLAGISITRYVYLVQQNYSLNTKLQDVENKIHELNTAKKKLEDSLTKEKQEYAKVVEDREQLKAQLQEQVDTLQGRLQNKEVELQKKEVELGSTKEELTGVQNRIALLKQDYSVLEERIGELRGERDAFEAKLNSLPELKKAIVTLKRKVVIRREELQSELDAQESRDGNKGYLTWQGKSTIKEKVTIEVLPFEPET
ncbi:hypothetical protein ACFL38_01140 [Candidatus Omnitrophota bacterium]